MTGLHVPARLAGLAVRPASAPVRAGRAAVAGAAWLVLAGSATPIVWLWLHGGGISATAAFAMGLEDPAWTTGSAATKR